MDISDYMAKNIELTGEIGLKYTEYLIKSEEEHLRINEEAVELMDEMANMGNIMSHCNFSQNEEGESIYKDGTEALDMLFEEYNSFLEERKGEIEKNVLAIYQDIIKYLTEYDRAVSFYKTEHEEEYWNTLEAIEKLFEEYSDGCVIVSAQELQDMEDTLRSQSEMLTEQQCIIRGLRNESEWQEETDIVPEPGDDSEDTPIDGEPRRL